MARAHIGHYLELARFGGEAINTRKLPHCAALPDSISRLMGITAEVGLAHLIHTNPLFADTTLRRFVKAASVHVRPHARPRLLHGGHPIESQLGLYCRDW